MKESLAPTPRRFGIVGPAAPWRGGIAQYADALSSTLKRRGHDTRIVSFRRQYPRLLFPGKDQRDPDRSPRPETQLALDTLDPISWFRAGRVLAAWGPDLVIFNYWLPFFVPMYATIVHRLDRSRTRIVFDCHNVRPHERRPLDDLLTGWMMRLPDAFVVHSDSVRETLLREKPDARAAVRPLPLSADFGTGPGREEARRRLGLSPDLRVLLFFGFVRGYKGLDVAMKAMAHLPGDVHLVVAGEIYDRNTPYRELARDTGGDRIHLFDRYIPTDEVGVFFDACDLVVLPYHQATQSGVLPLAWRFGVPVVATRVGGLTEHVIDGENGFLVAPGDAGAMARAALRALEPPMAKHLRVGVRAARETLSWDGLGQTMEELAGSPAR